MKQTGYIVVAINFVGGGKGVYRVRWGWQGEPTASKMRCQVTDIEEGHPDSLYFLGAPLADALESEEEFWMRVPPNGYTSASWRHYTLAEIDTYRQRMSQRQGRDSGIVIPR
jgi:hypothetical protein